MCLREKYLASAIISASLASSIGWIPSDPNDNQLLAPFTAVPSAKSKSSGTISATYAHAAKEPRRRKRQSTMDAPK